MNQSVVFNQENKKAHQAIDGFSYGNTIIQLLLQL